MRIPASRTLILAAILSALFSLSACRSDHVDITIQNETGTPIHLLEVDYPSASFGTQDLAVGASFHYRIQVQGTGPVTVTYTTPAHAQPNITGPTLADRQQGALDIVLQPQGKAEFHPRFTDR